MKITDYIRGWFRPKQSEVLYDNSLALFGGLYAEKRMPFANLIFYNICDLLTDICNDVTLTLTAGDRFMFAGLKVFFDTWSKVVLNRLFEVGVVVIGERDGYFWIMQPQEYLLQSESDYTLVRPVDSDNRVYVMKSQTYLLKQQSDKQLLHPFMEYLDNVLNGSNTVSARLGSMVIMSPQNPPSAPTTTTLTKDQKTELEKELSENYGSLRSQKQMMLLARPMSTQVINLAGLDQKTAEKAKLAILAICDRIKVPSNQVAIIDANSSKSLANGTELREGDFNKYQSFERLLNCTFIQMAQDLGLQVDYTIYNKPQRQTTL